MVISCEDIAVDSGYLSTVLDSETLANVFQMENIPVSHEVVIDETNDIDR